jgi:hypothetical protein
MNIAKPKSKDEKLSKKIRKFDIFNEWFGKNQ